MKRDLSVKIMACYHKHGGLNWFSLLKAHTNSELKYNQNHLRVKKKIEREKIPKGQKQFEK